MIRQRVVVIVQARMGSTRLPGKVLMDLAGRPMVEHVLRRARLIPGIDAVVLATTTRAEDDALAARCAAGGWASVHRGPADDVLERYRLTAEAERADVVVRVTADCPLLSPAVSGMVVHRLLDAGGALDYVTNTRTRSFPRGLDTEAFTMAALRAAAAEAVSPDEREHVTPFIWLRPQRFRIAEVVDTRDRSGLRWTVDAPADFTLASRLHEELRGREDFEYGDVLAVIERHPDWSDLNRDVEQK
ncbi:MAG: glycosyltransferase family protein, partial [Planctomycetes bacterium]|nr:glycosyltransferase family protein [Planctomycetota bacterium]